jgi:phospholipase/carboxylesterase
VAVSSWLRQTEHVVYGPAAEQAGLMHRVSRGVGPSPRPAIVMLHGRQGDEDAMWLLRKALPDGWLVVSPRGLVPDPDGAYDWRPRGRRVWPTLADFDAAVAAIARFTQALPALYGADPGAVFFMGFSQGAAAAFALTMTHRHLVSGVASVVGFVPAECGAPGDVRTLADLPVFMAVGRNDPIIPLSRSRACARALRSIGADLTYREYNAGHKLSTQGMRDLRSWWLERPEVQTRAAGQPIG